MRRRIALEPAGAGLAALLGTAGPALSASAGTTPLTSIPAPGSSFTICMNSNNNSCMLGQGGGNQVKTSTSGSSNWSLVNDGGIGRTDYQIQDSSGNCLREGTGNVVKLESGSCNANDLSDWWDVTVSGSGVVNLRNLNYTGDYAGVYGTDSGRPVWGYPKAGGFYTGWIFFT
jgi:hypothetical protein